MSCPLSTPAPPPEFLRSRTGTRGRRTQRETKVRHHEKRGGEMGKLVVTEFVSVDGVIEDPGGAEDYEYGGWSFEYDRGEDGNAFKLDETMEAEVQLLGRVTYEGFA